MKVLKIYYLNKPPYNSDDLNEIRDEFKVDIALTVKSCNQIQNLQYPLFEIEEF